MKALKRIVCFVLVFSVFICSDAILTLAQSMETSPKSEDVILSNDDYEYVIEDEKITIKSYKGTGTEVIVPEKIENYPVAYIGASAFSQCTELIKVVLPEGIESIGDWGFYGCSSLMEINLPESITGIGRDCFGKTGITEVTITPNLKSAFDAYRGMNLEKVTIEEGVTTIPDGILQGVTTITEITIPDGVKHIGMSAFSECTGLSKVLLPEGLESIGNDGFNGCSSLMEINLPRSLKNIGEYCFTKTGITQATITTNIESAENAYNNSNVEKVTIENGVTAIPNGALAGVKKLTEITIPESVKRIGYRAFYGCSSLRIINLPGNLTRIGSDCFTNCTSLEMIYWPEQLSDVDKSAFSNINEDVIVYVKANTPAMYRVIELELPFELYNNTKLEDAVVNPNSGYYMTTNKVKQGEHNTFVIDYSCDAERFSEITEPEICVYIPNSMNLNTSFIQMDDTYLESGNYVLDKKDRILRIPVSKASGTIKLSLKATGTGKIISYAALQYHKGQDIFNEAVGTIMMDVPSLSLNCSDQVADGNISISGCATALEEVNIYLNDSIVTTVTANKVGDYSTSMKTDKVGINKIKVELASKPEVYVIKRCKYAPDSPELTEFKFYYQQNENVWKEKNLLEEDSSSQIVSINPCLDQRYEFEIENDSQMKDVYITSTKNGERKSIKAKKNADGRYVAQGYFDPDNHWYIPGELSISYQLDDGLFDEIINVSEEKQREHIKRIIESLQDPQSDIDVDDITVTTRVAGQRGTGTTYVSTISNGRESRDLSLMVEEGKTTQTQTEDSLLQAGWKKYTKWVNQEVFLKYDINDDYMKLLYMVKDVSDISSGDFDNFIPKGSDIYSLTIDALGDRAAWLSERNDWAEYLGIVMDPLIYCEKYDEIDRDEGLSSEQKEQEKKKLFDDYMKNAAIKITGIILGLVICSLPGGQIAGVLAGLLWGTWGDDFFETMYDMWLTIRLAIIIDPSGYVYEAVEDNRLKGVKSTIYYKPDLDTETPILWDAGLYGQMNPLYTGEDGSYAWDVPEGYWQVKYELDGYETSYSEWMPVPPEQTDINIGMVSKSAPAIKLLKSYTDRVVVSFSQYMKPETISGIVLKGAGGEELSYTLSYDASKKSPAGTVLAKDYILNFAKPLAEKDMLSVEIPDTLSSYNGKFATAENRRIVVEGDPVIRAEDSLTIKYNSSVETLVEIENYNTEYTVSVSSTSGAALQADLSDISHDGKGTLTLKGNIPGKYKVTLQIDGTSVAKECMVNVLDDGASEPDPGNKTVSIDGAVVTLCADSFEYTGFEIKPSVLSVSVNGQVLMNGKDYQISYADNVNIGTGTVIVTGIGNYTGRVCTSFAIKQIDAGRAVVVLKKKSVFYNGKAQEPGIQSVKLGNKEISSGNYTVFYKNNINAGTATVVLQFKNHYAGKAAASFVIRKAAVKFKNSNKTLKYSKVKKKNRVLASSNRVMVEK